MVDKGPGIWYNINSIFGLFSIRKGAKYVREKT